MADARDLAPVNDERMESFRNAEPGGLSPAVGASVISQRARTPRRGSSRSQLAMAEELREIARAVRRIGRGRCASPEAILIEKLEAAERLFALAARLEVAR